MDTMMSPDAWVEIPEGEFQAGITDEQQEMIWQLFRDKVGYSHRSEQERAAMDAVLDKLRGGGQLTYEDNKLFGTVIPTFHHVPARRVHLKRFYIARFPFTDTQYELLQQGQSPDQIPAVWEEPKAVMNDKQVLYYRRCAAYTSVKLLIQICQQYNFRFPTSDEWEKAARGTDGRLYPWSSEWEEKRGFFYYGQNYPKHCAGGKAPVDAYPKGVSPYDVWNMAGGLPELVTVPPASYLHSEGELHGQQLWIETKGCYPKNSSRETAWTDHILANRGIGDYVTFHPVMDEWPKQQWPGVGVT
jgi:formylglycine-generating enzyme required for sulfatase activity